MRTSRANPIGALAYANPADPINAPFSSIEVRMVPENVTNVPRTTPPHQVSQMDERLVVIRHGETLEDVLRTASVPQATIAAIVAAFAPRTARQRFRKGGGSSSSSPTSTGRAIIWRLQDSRSMTARPLKASSPSPIRAIMSASMISRPSPRSLRPKATMTTRTACGSTILLYETALKQEIPRAIIDDLIRIFANDVDLQRAVSERRFLRGLL